MNHPIVSIISPTFNHEQYIEICIESVINQQFTNWEMLIVDDGSQDNTAEIIAQYSNTDTRIKYFYQENKGLHKLSETYNFALSQAAGEYIAILEGDDFWHPQKLKLQLDSFAQNKDRIFSWTKTAVVNNQGEKLYSNPRFFNNSFLHLYQNFPFCSIFQHLVLDFPIPASWLIRKSSLISIGGFAQHEAMPTVDLSTILQLSRLGSFCYLDTELAYYRRQMHQATRTRAVEIAQGSQIIFSGFYNQLHPKERANTRLSASGLALMLQNKIAISHALAARSFLSKKNYAEAIKNYTKTLFYTHDFLIHWRIKSFVGLFYSIFRLDLEKTLRFLGKNSY